MKKFTTSGGHSVLRSFRRGLRLLLLASCAALLLGPIGCSSSSSSTSGASSQERLNADASALSLSDFQFAQGDSATHVTQNFGLPASGANGSTISWVSSNPSLLAVSGSTATVEGAYSGQGEADVTLTATLSLDGLSTTVPLVVTVSLWDYSGNATYYNYSTGSCGYSAAEIPANTYVVAAPNFLNSGGALCGAWIQLSSKHATSSGSKSAIIDVMVVDDNPTANGPDYDFDLSSQAFAALGDPTVGILSGLDWRFIEGPDGTLKVRNGSSMNPYYLSFVVTGNKYGLAKLEIHDSGAYPSWIEVPRNNGATFSISSPGSSAFTLPVYFRFTDVHGQVVTGGAATDLTAGDIFDTGVQFPAGAGGGTLADYGF